MEARLQQRELFTERGGAEAPPLVLFREVDPFDLWVSPAPRNPAALLE